MTILGLGEGVRTAVHSLDLLKHCAPSRTRTDTGRILSPLPLPIGLWGPGGECSARKPDPGHRIPLKIGQIPNVRPGQPSSTICAPRVFFPSCRTGPGDTVMSIGRSLLKLPAAALKSRKPPSPEPFRSRLWTAGSLALRQYTAAPMPTHSPGPAYRVGKVHTRGAMDVTSDNSA